METKYTAYPVEEGHQLGDVPYVNKPVTRLLGTEKDELERGKGSSSHTEDVSLKYNPSESLQLPKDAFLPFQVPQVQLR